MYEPRILEVLGWIYIDDDQTETIERSKRAILWAYQMATSEAIRKGSGRYYWSSLADSIFRVEMIYSRGVRVGMKEGFEVMKNL